MNWKSAALIGITIFAAIVVAITLQHPLTLLGAGFAAIMSLQGSILLWWIFKKDTEQ